MPSYLFDQTAMSSMQKYVDAGAISSNIQMKEEPTRRILLTGWHYEVLDPFGISLGEFLSLGLQETGRLHEEAGKRCKSLLHEAWKRGMKQVIICNEKVVYETDENEILSTRVKEEAEKRIMPCYAFSAPDQIEECDWSQVESDDYYPTVELRISPAETSHLETDSVSVVADFDTGNAVTKAFDVSIIGQSLGKLSPFERARGRHPAGAYNYFRKRAKIWVKDEDGKVHSAVCDDIRLVEEWQHSPLVSLAQNRIGFVSRDIIRLLRVRVELDPISRSTRIYGA